MASVRLCLHCLLIFYKSPPPFLGFASDTTIRLDRWALKVLMALMTLLALIAIVTLKANDSQMALMAVLSLMTQMAVIAVMTLVKKCCNDPL